MHKNALMGFLASHTLDYGELDLGYDTSLIADGEPHELVRWGVRVGAAEIPGELVSGPHRRLFSAENMSALDGQSFAP